LTVPFHKATPFGFGNLPIENDSQENESFCKNWFKGEIGDRPLFFTKSCTQSLELALAVLELPKNSEVIIPSYGFVSLANAVVLNGLKCVFVDCNPESMNIDPLAIERAISSNTRAVIAINYGGLSCDYDHILGICRKYKLMLIEDNAHGIGGKFKNTGLGGIGDISTFSFDRLKSITCSEGGAISFGNTTHARRFEQISEFGTNRSDYFRGLVPNYEWTRVGTNTNLASPLLGILRAQLEQSEKIMSTMQKHWARYHSLFSTQRNSEKILLPRISEYCAHNGYMFWIKVPSLEDRNCLIAYLEERGVDARFHYSPLHQSMYGRMVGEFRGHDVNSTSESNRLIRLPLYYDITQTQIEFVVQKTVAFFNRA